MREEDIALIRKFGDWIARDRGEDNALAGQILALPASSRDAWLAQHPEAQTIEVLEALLHAASDPISVTELVLKHVATVRVPDELDFARDAVADHARHLRAEALAEAGAQPEKASPPLVRSGGSKGDIARAMELIEKFGLQRLLHPKR
ncbi:MAG: hypothetical protein DMF56_25025 [Acidobacteria bacterium]|nr:MAG: hypothetical protein DMF56_25025 [Acidobacteriota bacterium]